MLEVCDPIGITWKVLQAWVSKQPVYSWRSGMESPHSQWIHTSTDWQHAGDYRKRKMSNKQNGISKRCGQRKLGTSGICKLSSSAENTVLHATMPSRHAQSVLGPQAKNE